jgi:Uncharacterised nucleotidyltransferase
VDESERLICRAALAEPHHAARAWQEWRAAYDPVTATALLTWAGGYINRNLRRAGLDDPYLSGIARHNWLTNNIKLARATPLLTKIASRWRIVPLKSFGLGGDTESRRLRPLADIDFHVEFSEAEQLIGELMRQDFVPLLNADWPEITNRIMTQRGSWNFTHDGIDLDVHWKLFDHLDLATNRRLVRKWSVPETTAYGSVRILRPEATLCLLAVHQVMQESKGFSGLFDVHEMATRADPRDAAGFARETETMETLRIVLNQARELGSAQNRSVRNLLEIVEGKAPDRKVPRRQPVAGSIQTALASRPSLYRSWSSMKGRSRVERFLLKVGGPFSKKRIELGNSGRFVVDLSTEPNLGPGWHHLFPADRWRWAGNPDSRLAIQMPPGSNVAISVRLVPDAWRNHSSGTLGIFANGILMARAAREDHEVSFNATSAVIREFLEISLRPITANAAPHTGIHAPRNQLLAPISQIQIDIARPTAPV